MARRRCACGTWLLLTAKADRCLPCRRKVRRNRSLEDRIAHNLRAIRQSGQFRITDGRSGWRSPLAV